MSVQMGAIGRRWSRGAALVEAVVAIPMLILLFASLIFTWQLYREKGRITDEARLRFQRHYFNTDLYDSRLYDLVLNSEALGLETTVALATQAATSVAV